MKINYRAVYAIYHHEMKRFWKTIGQSILSPVISTSLYFIIFGTAIGSRIQEVDGVSYGAFIVPGMMIFSLLTQSMSNASFGIFFQKFTGTIYEILSAPISSFEMLLGFVGAATCKSLVIGTIILITAHFFVDFSIQHPFFMLLFFVLTCVSFSLFGFITGLWAKDFENIQLFPMLIVTPLVFLGGTFYSINMLPDFWKTVSLANPVLYLVSGFRWSFYGISDVSLGVSLTMIFVFLSACIITVWAMFRAGYQLRD